MKFCVPTGSRDEILTCGKAGLVVHADLRGGNAHRLLYCRNEEGREVPLYTISSDPQNELEFAVGGRDRYARIYDRRMLGEV